MPDRASILVVNDDPDVREMLRLTLAGDGYDVATVDNARDALDRLRSSDTACVLFDLDIKRIDVVQFRAAQRRDRALAWIPVIVMSARPDLAESAKQFGARACLRKPFDLDELRRTVARVAHAVVPRGRR